MHRTLIWLDIRPAGYPALLKVGYRITGVGWITGYQVEAGYRGFLPDFQLKI
jgi:hypothetical protein